MGRAIGQLDGAHTNVDDQMIPVRRRSCDCVMGWHGFCCKMSHDGLLDEEVAVRLYRRACAGVCAFLALSAACTK